MIYYMAAWLAIGLITCVTGIIRSVRSGRDLKVKDIPMCLLDVALGPITMFVGAIAITAVFMSKKKNHVVFRGRPKPREQPYID